MDIDREVLSELDKNNVAQAKEIALKSFQYIDYALAEQLRGSPICIASNKEGQQI
ncbi:hypothetical protein AB1K32_26365 [Metabacillus dongyingensis]|uniref:hypothetical protein n=1 Tax=Metabacillus dongyingensis TaxID=2874282 RepID=UPI003B8D2237